VIVISFFLTRIIVHQMGLELFGLFTTIGASGAMLNLFTKTLQLSVARELGVAVGKRDNHKLSEAFSSSFFIQVVSGLAFGLFGVLSAGWIASSLTVPVGYERTTWICLILTFIQFSIGIMASPFGGMIRAHQHLRTVALLELGNRISMFAVAILMISWPSDKMLFFVSGTLVCNLALQFAYVFVALRRYPESWPQLSLFSKESATSIFRYGSMALLSGAGRQFRRNGIAIILNIYFGNLVTAANGIAIRLSNLIGQFVGIITPVIQPAMNSNEGSGNQKVIHRLATLSSTFGLAIIIPIALPLMIETETVLQFWLNIELPQYTVLFSQLITMTFVVSMISKGHGMALHAQGNIGRLTMINQGLIATGIIVGAVIACRSSQRPWLLPAGELVGLIIATGIWQPWWVGKTLGIPFRSWFRYTLIPAVLYILTNSLLVCFVLVSVDTGIFRVILLGIASGCICFAILWVFGLLDSERQNLRDFSRRSVHKVQRVFRRSPNI